MIIIILIKCHLDKYYKLSLHTDKQEDKLKALTGTQRTYTGNFKRLLSYILLFPEYFVIFASG